MELFKLLGTIAIENEEANEQIEETSSKAGKFAESLKKGAATAAKFGTAVVTGTMAAGAALTGIASSAASQADEIDKMSAKIGMSKKAYQEWAYVLGQNGMDVNGLQMGMKTLVQQMDGAAKGTEKSVELFDALGVSIYDAEGKMKNQEDMFKEVTMALAAMENGTEKAALANGLLGRSGSEMMPMLNNGAEGIVELTDRAHELGLVMGDEAVTAGVVLGDTLDDVKKSAAMVGTKIGTALFPILQNLLDMVLRFMPQVQTIFDSFAPLLIGLMDSLMPMLFSLVESVFPLLVGLLEALLPSFVQITEAILPVFVQMLEILLPPLIQIAETVLPILSTLLVSVMQILSPILELLSPLLSAIMALLSPLLDLLNVILQPLIDLFTFLADTIGKVLGPVFEGIGTAISKVGEGFSWLKDKASESMEGMKKKIEENGGGIKGYFKTLTDSAKQAWEMAFNKMDDITGGKLTEIKNKMSEKLSAAKDAVLGIFDKIKSGIADKITMAKDVISGIIDKIKSIFKFSFELPKIKMPHFGITPKGWQIGDLLKGSIPKLGIEWYAEGGVMNKPTIFGRNGNNAMVGGEAGAEAIAPISTLQTYIREAVAEQNASNYGVIREAFTDALREVLPDMQEIVKVVPDETGVFRVVRDKAREFTQKTGNPAFA